MKYRKGDVVIVRFPFTDLSSSKKRPALIISNNALNKTGDFLMAQITSKEKDDALSLPIVKTDFVDNKELPLQSYIRIHKIFLLNESLIVGKATSMNSDFSEKVVKEIIRLIR